MDPKQLFADSRLTGFCVYCGDASETRDHVPSRILLDEPFPENLPVVECCRSCNSGFSIHEEYFACFLSCVVAGSTVPGAQSRAKIARILKDSPALAERIQSSLREGGDGELLWVPELERIQKVLLKLARGHMAYELSLPRLEEPEVVNIWPLPQMAGDELEKFIRPQATNLWPEIGSRAFIRAIQSYPAPSQDPWRVVQPNRYSYLVSQAQGDFVRLLIGDYLAVEIAWD
jgi:hypothetical protein